ncbi:DNA helicase PSH3 [Plasmodium brasilianum]|uniref:DNA helicase PSH3 n=1 Tax=Plasmodium brasilianum TaxID=5824 RepID=A0ACB9YGH6_PLABR|nr:DNA helicase PSH3 [Plasmodium brasilianum]
MISCARPIGSLNDLFDEDEKKEQEEKIYFNELNVPIEIINRLAELGVMYPSQIQSLTLKKAFNKNNMIIQSKNGTEQIQKCKNIMSEKSGDTSDKQTDRNSVEAYPNEKNHFHQNFNVFHFSLCFYGVILVPTRELCVQLYDNMNKICNYLIFEEKDSKDNHSDKINWYNNKPSTLSSSIEGEQMQIDIKTNNEFFKIKSIILYGGTNVFENIINMFTFLPNIIISTPGRLKHVLSIFAKLRMHIKNEYYSDKNVNEYFEISYLNILNVLLKKLIIDEMDALLEDQFHEQMKIILKCLITPRTQVLCYSSTYLEYAISSFVKNVDAYDHSYLSRISTIRVEQPQEMPAKNTYTEKDYITNDFSNNAHHISDTCPVCINDTEGGGSAVRGDQEEKILQKCEKGCEQNCAEKYEQNCLNTEVQNVCANFAPTGAEKKADIVITATSEKGRYAKDSPKIRKADICEYDSSNVICASNDVRSKCICSPTHIAKRSNKKIKKKKKKKKKKNKNKNNYNKMSSGLENLEKILQDESILNKKGVIQYVIRKLIKEKQKIPIYAKRKREFEFIQACTSVIIHSKRRREKGKRKYTTVKETENKEMTEPFMENATSVGMKNVEKSDEGDKSLHPIVDIENEKFFQVFKSSKDNPSEQLDSPVLLNIKHCFITINNENLNKKEELKYKMKVLLKIIKEIKFNQCFLFINNTYEGIQITKMLNKYNISSYYTSSRIEHNERIELFKNFRNNQLKIVVCTDVMSRGIDNIVCDLVINFDIPQSKETYIHRSGRCGRYGKKGLCISLCNYSDYNYLYYFKYQLKLHVHDFHYICNSLKNMEETQKSCSSYVDRADGCEEVVKCKEDEKDGTVCYSDGLVPACRSSGNIFCEGTNRWSIEEDHAGESYLHNGEATMTVVSGVGYSETKAVNEQEAKEVGREMVQGGYSPSNILISKSSEEDMGKETQEYWQNKYKNKMRRSIKIFIKGFYAKDVNIIERKDKNTSGVYLKIYFKKLVTKLKIVKDQVTFYFLLPNDNINFFENISIIPHESSLIIYFHFYKKIKIYYRNFYRLHVLNMKKKRKYYESNFCLFFFCNSNNYLVLKLFYTLLFFFKYYKYPLKEQIAPILLHVQAKKNKKAEKKTRGGRRNKWNSLAKVNSRRKYNYASDSFLLLNQMQKKRNRRRGYETDGLDENISSLMQEKELKGRRTLDEAHSPPSHHLPNNSNDKLHHLSGKSLNILNCSDFPIDILDYNMLAKKEDIKINTLLLENVLNSSCVNTYEKNMLRKFSDKCKEIYCKNDDQEIVKNMNNIISLQIFLNWNINENANALKSIFLQNHVQLHADN